MELVPGCPGQELTQWKHSGWFLTRTETARTERSLFLADAWKDSVCCCVLYLWLPVWKCFFPLTSTHKPNGFCCSFQNIWCIHQKHKGCYI